MDYVLSIYRIIICWYIQLIMFFTLSLYPIVSLCLQFLIALRVFMYTSHCNLHLLSYHIGKLSIFCPFPLCNSIDLQIK